MEEEKTVAVFVKRPGLGKVGKKIQVFANFFELLTFPTKDIWHYDVAIGTGDRKIPARLGRDLFKRFSQTYRKSELDGILCVFDGKKNMYAPEKLPFDEKEFIVELAPKQEFSVRIKLAAKISMLELRNFLAGARSSYPQEALQALDIILAMNASYSMVPVGRSFFPGDDSIRISDGAEVWLGFQASVRPAQKRLLLNVDVSAAAFIESKNLIDFICDEIGIRREDLKKVKPLNARDIKRVERALKPLLIETQHLKTFRSFKVIRLHTQSAAEHKFPVDEKGTEETVLSYFKKKHKKTLEFPNIPLVQVSPEKKNIFLPLELCFVKKGQRIAGKLNPRQTSDMIQITATHPADRMKKTLEGVEALVKDGDHFANSFGIKISKSMVKIDARILPPPEVEYSTECKEPLVRPSFGQWRASNSWFQKPSSIESWAWIILERKKFCSEEDVSKFVAQFCKEARKFQIDIADKKPRMIYGDFSSASVSDCLVKLTRGDKPNLICWVVAAENAEVYGEIKRLCETKEDICSQVMLSKHIKKCNPQYISNVLLKVNVKLGGINFGLKAGSFPFSGPAPFMIFGADVTHPGKHSTAPSIAAVVASMDGKPAQYASLYRAQASRTEIIDDLQGMARELLLTFYKRNAKRKPDRILFYRDGVSEGQFATVLASEVKALKAAFKSLEESYEPKITFVIVQKRHHARFFPASERDADRSGNCPAGTVIDTGVTHPSDFDFYLYSHAGLKGTSRPCHYYVLYDEYGFKADELQELTNKLCYTYARCTRSVSVVPPAYYAHLVAFRARFYAGSEYSDEASVRSGELTISSVDLPKTMARISQGMYFM